MATVIDEATGETVEVVPVQAVAAISMTSSVGAADMPPDAGKRIEEAMAAAAQNAMAAGEGDPAKIREAMLNARASVKQAMHNEWRDLRSQQQAAEQERK